MLKTLVRGAGATLAVQVASIGTSYVSQVLLARWLGVSEYGVYDLAIALSIALSFVGGLGFPMAILRFIPEYRVNQDWQHLQGILRCSWRQISIASFIIAAIGTIGLLWVSIHQTIEYLNALILGIWMMPLMTLINLQKQVARAFHKMVLAYAPYLIFYPLLLIAIAFIWQRRQNLIGTEAIALSMFSMLLILLAQVWLFRRSLDPEIRQVNPAYAIEQWWRVALPLMFMDGSSVILNQTDTFMLGTMLGTKAVGIYSAAFKTSLWVQFILDAVNAISAPTIAALYARGDRQGLQKLVSAIARWMFYPALAIAVGLIGFADPLLQLFGSEFTAAKGSLIALILGQLVNVGSGSVGYLLTMTGHQVQAASVMGATAFLNIVLNLVGIHYLGVMGAALATAFSMMLWNVWLHTIVVERLDVRPSILAALR
jgi:O-antigen/teichoic acid export membrane protein